jgi:Acetyltransferase (GNAT) domain
VSVIDVVRPAPRQAWREVLAADPGAQITQTPEWFEATLGSMRAVDVSRLYVLPDGRHLVLPLLRRSPLPGIAVDESCAYGDLLAAGGVRAGDVAAVWADLLRKDRAARIRLNTHYGNADRWEAGRPAGATPLVRHVHVLDLDGGFPEVWAKRFDQSARRSVRKAERSDVTVERDTAGRLTPVFYDLYRAWLEDRARESGMPPWAAEKAVAGQREPLEYYQDVAAKLGEACRLWVAWHAGEPVAATISLVHRDHAMYWRGYSRKELASPVRANHLLQKLAIEDACAAGCRSYSMGQSNRAGRHSGGVASLERFKEGLGAAPRPVLEYLIDRLPLRRLADLKHRAEAGALRMTTSTPLGRLAARRAASGGA